MGRRKWRQQPQQQRRRQPQAPEDAGGDGGARPAQPEAKRLEAEKAEVSFFIGDAPEELEQSASETPHELECVFD